MNVDAVLAALPWLAVLACPLVMFWMMRGEGRGRRRPNARSDK